MVDLRAGSSPGSMFGDLELHIGRGVDLGMLVRALKRAGDLFCVTGRGKGRPSFEYTFEAFVSDVCSLGSFEVAWDSRFAVLNADGEPQLFLLKGQELLCLEGIDVVLIGCPEDLPDGLRAEVAIKRCADLGGISLLGHPFKEPNNCRVVTEESDIYRSMIASAALVDCVVGFNQQLEPFFRKANNRAKNMAHALAKPSIAVSDSHLYRKKPRSRLIVSGISFDSMDFLWDQESQGAVDSLRRILESRRFVNHERGWCSAVDILSLDLTQIQMLYGWSGVDVRSGGIDPDRKKKGVY